MFWLLGEDFLIGLKRCHRMTFAQINHRKVIGRRHRRWINSQQLFDSTAFAFAIFVDPITCSHKPMDFFRPRIVVGCGL